MKDSILLSILFWLFCMLIAPFFSAVILKVKAFFGGKKGPPLLINYFTLIKLLKKGSVYSSSTSFIFKLGPMVSFSSAIVSLLFLPVAGTSPVFSFNGDVIFILYLMGLGRFFTIAAALDTASPFEGMGAAREAFFPIICEATLFMILILFYMLTGKLELAAYFSGAQTKALWDSAGTPLIFIIVSLFMVLLTENARVPVDDPATHLELTMIHEVMVLDHSGPDLAFIELTSHYKLLFFSGLVAQLISGIGVAELALNFIVFILALLLVYVTVGIVESIRARFRMDLVPRFILASFALAFFSAIITMELMK